ncbi:glycerophosphodiester phosphodiesterase family protein [Iodidimonas sp. SYSU 1G8]|uniref:glycerophosphodiester phosphodiesterase family protein n=1 Tax=Iodidimonas sp. SYSU 1G8 TaxID=3133967 RepID=UPI0031FE5B0B
MPHFRTLNNQTPIVIGHRGASGYFPEHTARAYRAAIEMGAHAIEPDLVVTADGHLVVRHDRYLGKSTDIADFPEFKSRRVVKPGLAEADWYIEDFTLAEIRTLKARQPFPGRSRAYDRRYPILTFDELLEIMREGEAKRGESIGFHPEVKHPDYFLSIGLDIIPPLLKSLGDYGYEASHGDGRSLFIQSFDLDFHRRIKPLTDISLTQLLEDHGGVPHVALETAAEFAAAIGPQKSLLMNAARQSTGMIERAHALNLLVHPWTFRDDAVGPGFGDVREELNAYLMLGVDGVFADFPDTALDVVGRHISMA